MGESVTAAPTRLRAEHREESLGIHERTPRLSWWLPAGSTEQRAYHLTTDSGVDTGWVESADSVLVDWPGSSIPSSTRVTWRVRVRTDLGVSAWSEPAELETGLVDPQDWAARWIVFDDTADTAGKVQRPAILARKDFRVQRPVARARLYATAHGIYEAFIDGRRVGDQELTPGFTSYATRLQVQTYDVTDLITEGTHTIGFVITDGWYRGGVGALQSFDQWGDRLALLAQLVLTHDDGSATIVGTGDGWRWSASGHIRADLMLGQVCEPAREPRGWDETAFDESGWRPTQSTDVALDNLCGSPAPPVRRLQEIPAAHVTTSSTGARVVDLGQNITGWVRFRTSPATHRQEITLTHREAVDPDTGDVYTGEPPTEGPPFDATKTNRLQVNRLALEANSDADTYIFEPRHAVHGFQYVGITGHDEPVRAEDVTGIVVATDLRRTGWFECSDERLNRLHEAARMSFLTNACDIPTDCPTRERSGWTGDWQLYVPTASFLYDVAGFTTKWLRDLAAEQRADGAVANLAPSSPAETWGSAMEFLIGSAGWGDAAILVPWQIWRSYGDTRLLAEQWPSMTAWLDYVARQASTARHPSRAARGPEQPHERYLWDTGHHWGEWLTPDGPPADLMTFSAEDKADTATAYFAHSAGALAQIADVLGRDADAAHYRELAANVRAAWRTEFLGNDGGVTPATQANCVRALAFDLVPAQARSRIVEQLVELVRERDTHLHTGFLATPLLLPVLADNGHADLAYELLYQDSAPSWLTMIDRGATTMWELWDGIDEHGRAHDSLNHYSKGAVVSFLYHHVAGLRPLHNDPDAAGYRHFEVRPVPGGALTSARATLDTPYGLAESAWQSTENGIEVRVLVPPGTRADVYLPSGQHTKVGPGHHVLRDI